MVFPKFLKIAVRSSIEEIKVNETVTIKQKVFDSGDVQLTQVFAQALQFSYELVSPSDGEMGRELTSGNWSGMVGMIHRNDADLAVSILSFSEDRLKVVDFSYPFHRTPMTFATRKPQYIPEFTSFLKPFSFDVWSLIMLCLCIMPLLFYLIFRRKYPFQTFIFATYGSLLQKEMTILPQASKEYFLLTIWRISVTFLSYCYTAVLLSYLTFPPLQGVRTARELAAEVSNGRYQCYTIPGGFISNFLSTSIYPHERVIGFNLQQTNGRRDIDEVLGNTKPSKIPAFFSSLYAFLHLKHKYFISHDEFPPGLASVAMRKDFCCKQEINRVIDYIWASGISEKIVMDNVIKRHLKTILKSSHSVSDNEARKLTLEDFKGVFVLLLMGYLLSLVVFTLEFFIRDPRNCRK